VAVRIVLLMLLAMGCKSTATPCREWQTDKTAYSPLVQLSDELSSGMLSMQVTIPGSARYSEGTPVVVYVHGGWGTDAVPLPEAGPRLRTDLGFATLYLNLPGGDEEHSSEGSNDLRGSGARQALGAALRYAAGDLSDDEDCSMDDRLPGGFSGQVVMAGWSNGGNLAWTTAADTEVEIPLLDGIATFETPTSAQMLTVEPGTTERPADFFDAETCELTDAPRLSCPQEYENIQWDPDASEETEGALFIDDDEDGILDANESTLDPVWSPAEAAWMHPVEVVQAASHLSMTNRAGRDAATAFWTERVAIPHVAGAQNRFPSLAGMATGTQIDHVLTGLEIPVHVTGLVAAMYQARVSFHRLHPDEIYIREITSGLDVPEYDAGLDIAVVDPSVEMEPEDGTHIRGTDYLSVSALELLDRAQSGNWSSDLWTSPVEHP